MKITSAPTGLRGSGRRLYLSVTGDFELSDHELARLVEACHVMVTIEALRKIVADDGMVISGSQGDRVHPAVAEIRAQQLALSRILSALDIPMPGEDSKPTGRARRAS